MSLAKRCLALAPLIILMVAGCRKDDRSLVNWETYLGDKTSSQYSQLDQINRENVAQLEVAWIYRSGDAREDGRSQIQCNPIIIDSVLYGTSPRLKLLAVHASTGREIWRFDPAGSVDGEDGPSGVNRGVAYWTDGDDARLFFVAGPKLYAIDARTGSPAASFGENGTVDFHDGLDREVSDLFVSATSPGVVYRDLLIIGSRVSEGSDAAPGHIRAYDVRTGERAWIFHTIPHPGEYGYDTWPEDAWLKIGGANSWSGMSLDEKRGWVFIPTGSAAFDFYGGNRPGMNLFANSVLVLDAATGRRIWHYQTVHHDIWDRDLPAPPNLVRVTHNGRTRDAVAQITKSGYVFLLDRETGEPLFPVEERPVPASDLRGEQAWPTQPFPTKPPPFARQVFNPEDVTNLALESHDAVAKRLAEVRSAGQFVPPSEQGTIIFPGFDGGAEWGGAAFDPETGRLYVNSNEMPWILTMVDVSPQAGQLALSAGKYLYTVTCAACHGVDRRGDTQQIFPTLVDIDKRRSRREVLEILERGKGNMPSFGYLSKANRDALIAFLFDLSDDQAGLDEAELDDILQEPDIPYVHTGWHRFFDPEGYPAVKPPWGTLNAINLNTGEIDWTVPLGELPELTERGIPPTGTENYGGPVVTAGGLVFIAASKDEKFRAFDKATGDILWETTLPAGGYATPATYMLDGRQYVVIAAGGGKMGTDSRDAYVAFALPN